LALDIGAEAIHPGYGFLAEDWTFIEACEAAGLTFIGPRAETVAILRQKVQALNKVAEAGFPTTMHSPRSYEADEFEALRGAAGELGYPLVIKSCRGGRGRGQRLVWQGEQLEKAFNQAKAEANAVYGASPLYLEQAIMPAHQIGVQVLGDKHGRVVHFGEREGSLLSSNRKLLEESPSPSLTAAQREAICNTAVEIASLFNYSGLGTVEFLLDDEGHFCFTEMKARLQVESPLTEMRGQIDLVREQIRIAAGEPLGYTQNEVRLTGWAMSCRLLAEDPWNHFMPSPGYLSQVRLPCGTGVRMDTYINGKGTVPPHYDSLFAKVTTWGETREMCLGRMRTALEDTKLIGTPTNLSVLRRMMHAESVLAGTYDTDFLAHPFAEQVSDPDYYRDLAAVTAVLYLQRNQGFVPEQPERFGSGWHKQTRSGRRG
ncbi:MAG: ATP-grasp domain-containing protein, partial [Anaerolineales bacterium]|nr:ATP-grasp domain-containing protein [Anaerolineales bacterium]